MKRIFVYGLGLLACCFSSAFGAGEKLQIASLSTVLTDFARQIGGDRVEVVEIVDPGTDPHLFQPTTGDVRKIEKADLVLASGMNFESYLKNLRQAVGDRAAFVVVGDYIKNPIEGSPCTGHDHDHDHADHDHHHHGELDPHWWHSIKNARTAVEVVGAALAKLDPKNKKFYEQNTRDYLRELSELEKWVKQQLAALPKDRRVLVTSHDAMGYFARDFGFEVLPVSGISSADQPSSQHVRKMIDQIKEKQVKAIFAESIENPRVLREITKETGARQGGILYADGLGSKEAATYDAMMRHNVSTIVSGLQ